MNKESYSGVGCIVVAVSQVTTIPTLCTMYARLLVLISSHAMELFQKTMPGDTSKYLVRRLRVLNQKRSKKKLFICTLIGRK
jgi:hypothetical protein